MPEQEDRDYRAVIKEAASQGAAFLRLTASGGVPSADMQWIKAVVRPVRVGGAVRLQFEYFDSRRCLTQNYDETEAEVRLDELLQMPFSRFHVQTTTGDVHVRITRKGKALLTRGKPSRDTAEPVAEHDRKKQHVLAPDRSGDFLRAMGMLTGRGKVRHSMQGKFRQVNRFVELTLQLLDRSPHDAGAVEIVDCGCGSAYLTFAVYHYLRRLRDVPAKITGIDADADVIAKCRRLKDRLGWEDVRFENCRILEFTPGNSPDLVLSLHACDTATDEAIAQGVLWGSRAIVAVPCCQHELRSRITAEVFKPVLRHGILKQRMADLLTDAFRALVLRIMGYRTDVVEFVSPEHTAKNLMIRASHTGEKGDAEAIREYLALRDFWGVEPSIEDMIGSPLRGLLTSG